MVDIELIAAGSYRVLTPHPEGAVYHLIKTEWEGPEGGRRYIWEAVRQVQHSWYRDRVDWLIEDYSPPALTLKEARANLAIFFQSVGDELERSAAASA
jgi:hypothetical protein